MHYLMLGGLLNDTEIGSLPPGDQIRSPNHGSFNITDDERKKSWSLRCVMMWCALQILFCKWTISGTSIKIRHHVEYIYTGVMDFYISLWFYAMCLLKFNINRSIPDFEQFHYYYISCYPFFKPQHARNISTLVLENEEEWINTSTLADINQKIVYIYEKMFAFWRSDIQSFARFITQQPPTSLQPQEESRMKAFFIPPDAIQRKKTNAPPQLTIKAYEEYLTPHWYWFHFKQITIPRIRARCGDYDAILAARPPPTSVDTTGLWRAWFQRFDARVRDLGACGSFAPPGAVRAVMRLRRGGVGMVRS